MSILQTPRILFKGEISWDPITTNNYSTFYDENSDETVLEPPPPVSDQVAAFRKAAIAAVTTEVSWNPHGTHRSTFYDAAVSGVDLGAGVTTRDPFVKSNASFTGMLVDIEPYGALSSQLFFDKFQLGVRGGYEIACQRSTRFTDRYINFARNPANAMIAGIASVVWQTSFYKDLLHVGAFDSPALLALEQALAGPDVLGLTVRFTAYRTIYYDDLALTNKSPETQKAGEALIEKLTTGGLQPSGGGFQPNPARSKMVGAIGLWLRGEPIHEPGDRALLAARNPRPGEPYVGTAHARLDSTSLTIDLSNSTPEDSKELTKADLGTLSVVAIDPTNGARTTLGTILYSGYDKAAYEASSGIVVLRLTGAEAMLAATSNLQILDGAGKVQLDEAPLRAIPVVPNTYIDQGQTAEVAFQVYERGAPARRVLPLGLYQMSADGSTITSQSSVQTDESGLLRFSVPGTAGGLVAYVAAPDLSQAPGQSGINSQVTTYLYVRTLAADADVAALPPTWANVYNRVLANWNAMAPCMDNWLLLNDPAQVKAYGPMVKRLTDPARLEDFRYMPVTRDLTPGARTLLYAYLDGGAAAAASPAATPATTANAAPEPNFAELSRSMRRP